MRVSCYLVAFSNSSIEKKIATTILTKTSQCAWSAPTIESTVGVGVGREREGGSEWGKKKAWSKRACPLPLSSRARFWPRDFCFCKGCSCMLAPFLSKHCHVSFGNPPSCHMHTMRPLSSPPPPPARLALACQFLCLSSEFHCMRQPRGSHDPWPCRPQDDSTFKAVGSWNTLPAHPWWTLITRRW